VTGRKLAVQRHAKLLAFLKEFEREWAGDE
jgi:hypothetical protein